ncbi:MULTISPECIES: putative 2OG-Fe(II) oxygenase [unclassified Sphingomonas]|uniref:putative 2OG-Fe(II) oxygenase n=1 Tax=unclassified Sphingomonas TaxID=196159 RepID=UPI00226AB27D|nr:MULTISPECIES: putative 2OG-Fe(II) oxygenase [unclassified Sphingomonas]
MTAVGPRSPPSGLRSVDTFRETLRQARRDPNDPRIAVALAQAALKAQEEALAEPIVTAAAEQARTDARLWQWSGLLQRALDDRGRAIQAFARAARIAPTDKSIAHGHARVVLEAGLPATQLFEKACRIAPLDGDILLGLAAARVDQGDAATAIEQLAAVLADHPGWLVGHQTLARLRWMMGEGTAFVASIHRALGEAPRDISLWRVLIATLSHARSFDQALAAIDRGRTALSASAMFDAEEAVVHSEIGATATADALFVTLGEPTDMSSAVRRVRHLLRSDRIDAACALIDRWITMPDASLMWPYASAAWRMTGDRRGEWLDGSARLVSITDLADRLPHLDKLVSLLTSIHRTRAQPFDQSVRGGTQTDGVLLARIEPEIRALRATIADAVKAHVAALPKHDPYHPTLRAPRDRPVRFSGSWSVRLESGGYHSNHVHPAGWLSSVLYIALPPTVAGEPPDAGWLTLGAPQAELGLDLTPIRRIEPKPGRLVLFPSTMWHGTVPFAKGERLTVAFDVQEPIKPS